MKKEFMFSVRKGDFDIQTFCSGGPGGQHQNKTDSGVRIVHRESGAVGESRTERSQYQNKRIAFERLSKSVKFKLWLNRKVYELSNKKTIEQMVDESLKDDNLKIEIKDESGRWTEQGVDNEN